MLRHLLSFSCALILCSLCSVSAFAASLSNDETGSDDPIQSMVDAALGEESSSNRTFGSSTPSSAGYICVCSVEGANGTEVSSKTFKTCSAAQQWCDAADEAANASCSMDPCVN